MSSPRIQEANDLVETIAAALAAAELDQVTATTDAGKVPSGARNGIVLVAPPTLAFPTWHLVEPTWTLHVIAGPATDYLAAWATIDGIVQALFDARTLNFDEAEPSQYAPLNAQPLPAYTITLNP